MDTTGGPLKLLQGDGTYKSNPKWCQNPQYHIEIVDPFGKEEVYLKIVVKRTDSQTEKRTTKYGNRKYTICVRKIIIIYSITVL